MPPSGWLCVEPGGSASASPPISASRRGPYARRSAATRSSRSIVASQCAAAAWSTVDECRSAACLAIVERPAQRLGRAHPADPQARRRDLRQRREREHAVVERGERRQRLAAVAQLAVRVVLEQPEAAGAGERDERLAALERERAAGRVLERRDRVEQPGAVLGGERGRRLGIEPVVVAGHGDDGRARELECLQRREVRRLLHEHRVAGLEQHGGDQRERLLGAARDQQLVGVRRQPARGEPRGDGGAQRRVALRRRVLQRAADGARRPARRRRRRGARARRTTLGRAGRPRTR